MHPKVRGIILWIDIMKLDKLKAFAFVSDQKVLQTIQLTIEKLHDYFKIYSVNPFVSFAYEYSSILCVSLTKVDTYKAFASSERSINEVFVGLTRHDAIYKIVKRRWELLMSAVYESISIEMQSESSKGFSKAIV